MKGTRVPDGEYVEEPGGYSKHVVNDEVCWMVMVPSGGRPFFIGRSNADGSPRHWIQENADGTITVRANPPDAPKSRRNSNSILAPNGWHGYLYEGVWGSL